MRKFTGIFFALLLAGALASATAVAAPVAVSVSVFHDQLAPHGRWVVAGSYGSCWVPSGVAVGWAPYVDGEWVYSDYGWTWDTADPWGDVPYHYGTWAWVDPYGWVWAPGTVWAPAWVTWAYTDDYIGWAPVPPTFALTATGYFGPAVVVAPTRYVFVPTTRFVGVPVATVRVAPAQSAVIMQRATKTTRFEVSNGVVTTAGLPAQRIERAMGKPIPRVAASQLRAQPTTLAAAGVASSKSVRVVAPEKERAQLATEKTSAPAKTAEAARSAEKKSAKPAPAHEQSVRKSEPSAKPKAAPQKESKETAQHKAPEHPPAETHQANKEHAQPAPKAKPKPKPAEPHAAEPEKEKPKPSGNSAHKSAPKAEPEAKPEASVHKAAPRPEPENRPVTEAQKRPAPNPAAPREHASRPAEPKPHPKPQPPKEKEQPSKDSGAHASE